MVPISDGAFFCVPISLSVFVDAMYFVTSVKMCTMVIEVSSAQSRSRFCIYIYRCMQSAAAAAAAAALCVDILLLLLKQQCCCSLLLFVIVGRMAKFGASSLNLIPVVYFSSFKRDQFLMYPLAV